MTMSTVGKDEDVSLRVPSNDLNNTTSGSSASISTNNESSSSWSLYRNNADKILAKSIDIRSPNRENQILEIATILTPFVLSNNKVKATNNDGSKLVVATTDEEKFNDDDTSLSSSSSSTSLSLMMNNVTIQPLNGGLSNDLFTIRNPNTNQTTTSYNDDGTITTSTTGSTNNSSTNDNTQTTSNAVLVRIHPEEGEMKEDYDTNDCNVDSSNNCDSKATTTTMSLVNREIENKLVAWLSTKGIGPKFYGRFRNGRIEEFYSNVVPLSCHEMNVYAKEIATCMATFHTLVPPNTILIKPKSFHEIGHFINIEKWFLMAYSSTATNNKTTISFLNDLKEKWIWLRSYLMSEDDLHIRYSSSSIQSKAFTFIREIVLAHMDCQSLNILKDASNTNNANTTTTTTESSSSSSILRLIDFEYAGWNPRAADIANTFCEYCDMNNLKGIYSKEYPTIENQNKYLYAYVNRVNPTLMESLLSSNNNDWEIFVSVLRTEINKFTLLSCLGWAVWSVVKANESSTVIDFDYLHYARHRIDGYNYFKSQFIS